MPVRKIPKNYRNVTGIAAQSKAIGEAQFESPLERDFIALLEFSPEVVRYEVQPVRIEWKDAQGKLRYYRPDVRVEFCDELKRPPWLYEVKCREDLRAHWDELRPKFRQGIRYARKQGWVFHLVSDVEIRTPYLANARFLLGYRNREIPEALIDAVMHASAALGEASVEQVLHSLSDDPWQQAEYLPAIWYLTAHGHLHADLQQALTMASPIRGFT